MSALSQITSISAMNMRAVPQRLGTSFVIVIGIAGVVAVMLAMLAMSTGLLKTMAGAGRDDRAIVVRAGSAQELASALAWPGQHDHGCAGREAERRGQADRLRGDDHGDGPSDCR